MKWKTVVNVLRVMKKFNSKNLNTYKISPISNHYFLSAQVFNENMQGLMWTRSKRRENDRTANFTEMRT